MPYTILPAHLIPIAEAANRVIRDRFNLGDGIIEQEIMPEIPLQPTLHWKTPTHFIACEVADRPFPTAVKTQFADITATGQPIRLLVAYPSTHGLSHDDYRRDTKQNKAFGIGYLEINPAEGVGQIEYQGISLPLHLSPPRDLKIYVPKVRTIVQDAFDQYMPGADPRGAVQNLGQAIEGIVYQVARQAKKKGRFAYANFQPPAFIAQSILIRELIKEAVMDIPILGRCRDFADDRNGVSHRPRSRREAIGVETCLKDNFIIATRILEDLPKDIKKAGYTLRV
jgi:hypothetical protein